MKKCSTFCLSILLRSAFLMFWCLPCSGLLLAQGNISESTLPLPTQRLIRSMATGPEGYLWLGTQRGLFRYDGHRFVSYTNAPDKIYRISQNDVLDIFPTNDGKLVLYNNISTVDILNTTSNELTTIDLGATTSPRGQIRTASRQPDGRIYFITEHSEGYTLFEYSLGEFHTIFSRRESRPTNPKMTASGNPRFHLASQKDGSFIIYDQENGFIHFGNKGQIIRHLSSIEAIGRAQPLNFLQQENEDKILLAFSGKKGVYHFEKSSGKVLPDPRFENNYTYGFCKKDEHDNLLFGMYDDENKIIAFLILDSEGQLTKIKNPDIRPPSEQIAYGRDFLNYFYTISASGLTRIRTGLRNVKSYLAGQNMSMRGIIEDERGNLIIATEWNGWYKLDKISGEIGQINTNGLKIKDLAPPQYARNLLKDGNGDIWISAYGNPPVTSTPDGYLLRYRPSDGSIEAYKNKYRIEAILLSKSGQFYIASHNTLQTFSPETKQFYDIPGNYGFLGTESVNPNCIIQSRNGLLWLGTEKGLARFDTANQNFQFYGEESNNEVKLSNNNIMAIYEDAKGLLWLGTQGGLNVFDPRSEKVKVYSSKNGLPDNNICGLMPDETGGLWISTYKGLSYLNQEATRFRNFYTSDGFNHNEFNRHSLYRAKDGTYYIGGMDGFNAFKAEDLLKVNSKLKIFVSEIAYFDAKGDSLITLTHGLSNLKTITLPAANRYLQVRFGLDNFSHPELNNYSVFLEGYDSDWTSQGNVSEARYNNLPPGSYRLLVRGTGPSGTLSENTIALDIVVKQFFYKSPWFYLLLLTACAGLTAIWIIRLRSEKNRLTAEVERRTSQIRSDKETIEKQAKELQTLDRMKSRFFANISHELRTPLTLILGPLGRLLKKDDLEISLVRQHLALMKKNGKLLQYQIEELLELSRLDAGKAILRENPVNLKFEVQQIVDRFRQMAVQKDIELSIDWSLNINKAVLIDKSKFEKILGNLISNAVKFTSSGKVAICVSGNPEQSSNSGENLMCISVSDSGHGISSEDLPYIFDRYFQTLKGHAVGQGTGIGLSMAKEFAELMGGTITVESKPGIGSHFTLILPLRTGDYQWEGHEEDDSGSFVQENVSGTSLIPKDAFKENKEFTVLLAEDNTDLRNFLRQILEAQYKVVDVENGKQALEYLLHQATSVRNLIVLSDVMMPEMDGFTLLDKVRSQDRLRRIPFIMLTAKADGENRLRALRMGVDDYLLKPFDEEELLVRITNLLSNLSMRQQAEVEIEEITDDEYEVGGEWLEMLENKALELLTDPKMGMDLLAEKMDLSRSSLHRRIKAETGLTPNIYIREIRLQEARRLLENNLVSSVAEAGQKVGIQKRAYFSKLYLDRFGRLPSSYSQDISSSN